MKKEDEPTRYASIRGRVLITSSTYWASPLYSQLRGLRFAKKAFRIGFENKLVGAIGFEPMTNRLWAECSTTELYALSYCPWNSFLTGKDLHLAWNSTTYTNHFDLRWYKRISFLDDGLIGGGVLPVYSCFIQPTTRTISYTSISVYLFRHCLIRISWCVPCFNKTQCHQCIMFFAQAQNMFSNISHLSMFPNYATGRLFDCSSWSGRRDSNPRQKLGRLLCYHYTTSAYSIVM